MAAHKAPSPDGIAALEKADRLQQAADTYEHIFSNELKPPK
jgi:hypothetical protein